MTEQERALLQNRIDAPTHEPKLVLADWYEEKGKLDLAHAFRWAAQRRLHPRLSAAARAVRWARRPKNPPPRLGPHRLPWMVFDCMPGSSGARELLYRGKGFAAFREAFEALGRTLLRMISTARLR